MSLQSMSTQTLPGRPLSVSADNDTVKPSWAGPSRFGYIVIIIFFGGLGGWAGLAPLASGVNVGGTIQADTGPKTVQHLEGGLVKEILVREGDRVAKGEVLLKMDPLRTGARSLVQQSSLVSILAERARILAEIAGDSSVKLDDELIKALEHPIYGKIVESELKLFDERKSSRAKSIAIRQEQMAQTETQLVALDIRLETAKAWQTP